MHRHVYSFIVMILAATLIAACGSRRQGTGGDCAQGSRGSHQYRKRRGEQVHA